MKTLVTGACGLVGTQLVSSLLKKGHQVVGVGVDVMWFGNFLKDHENLQVIETDIRNTDAIPMEGTDAVIHLANVANDPCSDLNSKMNWEVNGLATKFLVEKAIDNGVKQFIYANSGSVYGIKDEDEVTEELSLAPITDVDKYFKPHFPQIAEVS
jgi:nucleoside-diphosphate-sugar epimerase